MPQIGKSDLFNGWFTGILTVLIIFRGFGGLILPSSSPLTSYTAKRLITEATLLIMISALNVFLMKK